MYYDKQKVIDLAWSQVGYHEKESNAQLDDPTANAGDQNWTKYARDLDSMGGFYNGRKQGFAWCDVFVDWLFVQSYGRAGAQYLLCQPDNSAGAGCSFSAQYFNSAGRFHKSGPEKGDQIFFGSAWNNVWHTGWLLRWMPTMSLLSRATPLTWWRSASTSCQTPTSLATADRAGGTPDSSSGTGTGNDTTAQETPQKPAESATAYMYDVKLPLLMIGDRNGYVKAAQTLLIALGYDCGNKPLIGTEKADGDFGRATERAVAFFQSKNNLEVDGEIGGATWAALLNF